MTIATTTTKNNNKTIEMRMIQKKNSGNIKNMMIPNKITEIVTIKTKE